MVEEFAGDF